MALPQIYLARSLRPLLADAPRTEKRIRLAEQLPKIAVSVSGSGARSWSHRASGMTVCDGLALLASYSYKQRCDYVISLDHGRRC
jgi:hypothetical protein